MEPVSELEPEQFRNTATSEASGSDGSSPVSVEQTPTTVNTEPDTSNWPDDGIPFFYRREHRELDSLWRQLISDRTPSPGPVGFIQFQKQSRLLKGRKVTLQGRLLRSVYVPVPRFQNSDSASSPEPQPLEALTGYYETWVLLSDEKRIPARLL
ncbi:MAG: hypothetical protein IKW74_01255, partial [Thermoguttaceae bacterium]|nr:hypothetical protein [Thermoguttaceae bacterium]